MAKPTEDSKAMPRGLHIAPPPRDSGQKPLFRVVYAIDIDASSPCEAAKNAHDMMRDPASMPAILDVLDHRGNVTRVDLCENAGANQNPSKAEARENGAGGEPVVILTVSRGVAELLCKPAGIGMTLFDYDVEGEDRSSTDPDGRACSISEWPASEQIVTNEHWPIIRKAVRASKRPYSREWKCLSCGKTLKCSYEDLAEVGCPYCSDCDIEMRLA